MPEHSESKKPAVLTREELHRRVWEVPMTRLAKEYGVSANGLAKICRRLSIPYPPSGYWAKKAAGKKVGMAKLPPTPPDAPERITVRPSVAVSDRLLRPHKIIAGWLTDHEHRVTEARTHGWWDMTAPLGDMEMRRHRILDVLFKEVERKGGVVLESNRRELYVEQNGAKIEFQLREKQKQVRRTLTEDEMRRSWYANRDFKKELQPTGRLVFAIRTYGLRREWSENDNTSMEQMLPDIVAAIEASWPFLEQRTRERKEAERQCQIAELQRHEEQQQLKLERNRWWRFVALAKAWQDAKLAHEFVATLRTTPEVPGELIGGRTVSEWIAWAEAKIRQVDPALVGPKAVFKAVAEIQSRTCEDCLE